MFLHLPVSRLRTFPSGQGALRLDLRLDLDALRDLRLDLRLDLDALRDLRLDLRDLRRDLRLDLDFLFLHLPVSRLRTFPSGQGALRDLRLDLDALRDLRLDLRLDLDALRDLRLDLDFLFLHLPVSRLRTFPSGQGALRRDLDALRDLRRDLDALRDLRRDLRVDLGALRREVLPTFLSLTHLPTPFLFKTTYQSFPSFPFFITPSPQSFAG